MATEKPYCTAPWTGLIVKETGDIGTCCVGNTILGNIKSKSIIDILQSPKLEKIKKDLLDNKPNSNCQACYNLERTNRLATLKNHFNLHYPNLDKGLQYLDLRWNNLCNLNCVYCGPGPSSTWADKLFPNKIKTLKNTYDSELEEWVLSKSKQIHELILIGGEPLLMKQNISLLQKIPDHARVSVITNLSYNLATNPCAKILFERPADNTLWNISVENYGEKFEYIRTGAEWTQFRNNVELLVKRAPNTVTLASVYGIFSALNLFDTVKTYYSIGIKKIQIGMIMENPALDVFNFPITLLKIARDQLQQVLEWQKETFGADYELYKCNDIETLLTKLDELVYNNSHKIISKSNFVTEIEKYDRWTKQKFSELWADEYNLILKELHD